MSKRNRTIVEGGGYNMVLKTPMDKLIIFLCMIIWCFRHKCMSPTFHNGPIPFGPFLFDIYTSNTPSATLSRILDNGIGMVDSNFAYLIYPPFPTQTSLEGISKLTASVEHNE